MGKYLNIIQSNLTLPSSYNVFPNSDYFMYNIIKEFHKDIPKKVTEGLYKSYLLSDNKPGIWYMNILDKRFFVYCYSVGYRDATKQCSGFLSVQVRSFIIDEDYQHWESGQTSSLGKVRLDGVGKIAKALKLAAEARAVVKRASNLKDISQVNELIFSVDNRDDF